VITLITLWNFFINPEDLAEKLTVGGQQISNGLFEQCESRAEFKSRADALYLATGAAKK
jgi:hypothetical protein